MRKTNDNTKLRDFAYVICFLIVGYFILSMVPEQSWSYDKRPFCNEGYTAALSDKGSYLVCVQKGGYYDTTGR